MAGGLAVTATERRAAIAKKAARMMSVEEVEAADTARRVRHQHCARVTAKTSPLPCPRADRLHLGCIGRACGRSRSRVDFHEQSRS